MAASELAHPAAEAIVDLYQRHAHGWTRDRGTALLERAWLDRLVENLAPGATVLDIGCGSGDPIARHLLGRGFAVTGVDSSPALIAIAAERLPAAEWPAANWIACDMRALDFGRRFDALLAWHSFFHLTCDAQRRMFRRFARHAAPGAALIFTSGPEQGEAIGSWRGEPLYHASLDPAEYRRLLDHHRFELVEHRSQDAGCGGAYIWLSRRRA